MAEERGGLPIPSRVDVPPPPHWRLEAVAATERPRDLAVGPDGRRAALIWDRDTSDVWTIDATTGATRRLTTGRGLMPWWEDTPPAISPDGGLVAYADEGWLLVVPTEGGPPRRLVEGGEPVWCPDGSLLATVERDRRTILVRLHPDDPWPQPVAAGDGDCQGAVPSPDGALAAFVFSPHDDRNRSEIHVADLATGKATALTGRPQVPDRGPAWSPDGARVAFTSQRGEWREVFTIAPDGSGEAPLTDAGADFAALTWRAQGLAATRDRHGRSDLVTIEPTSGAVTTVAAGGCWGPPQWLADGSLLASYDDFATPPELRVVAPGGQPRVVLAPAPAAVRAAPHVVPEPVTYRSFDGREIPGWLYRPPGASADAPVPAVVNPHGGPTDRDGDEWFGVAQYFVDKGYAWLMPNFRGSTSWGREHEWANHGVWGVDDTQDCLAAHDLLAGLDWIDEARIAIYGGSYGSYLALCSVVDDPEHRYRCALTKYGDCDILTSWAQGDRSGVQDMERMMPHPHEAADAYRAGSPIHRIEALEVPILVAHGERDERVHPQQSEQLVEALRRLGKTYEYVTYPGEAHGFLSAAAQVDYYRRVERFLDWCLI
jgi:dipeptidyl aminopeptidase/acylaminoacyl peptidase